MTNGDITWAEMWAEEERQRQAAAEAGWQIPVAEPEASGPRLAPEPYFGEPTPHYPEPQPYFEFSPDPVDVASELGQPPALRVTLPSAPVRQQWHDVGDEPVEGLDELDWQAPPSSSASSGEPAPTQHDRDWDSTWADGIHRHRPRHAK